MRRALAVMLFLVSVALVGERPATALSVSPAPLEVLLQEAQLVVVGTVVATHVEAGGGTIHRRTRYRVRVDERVSGDIGERAFISVLLPGGSLDGYTTHVSGIPHLTEGTRAVFLLEQVAGEWMPLGYRLGVLPVAGLTTGGGLINGYVNMLALSGEPARWDATCLTYYLETASSADLVREEVEPQLAAAFNEWNRVEGAFPVFGYGGASCGGPVGLEPLLWRNMVVFREAEGSWLHPPRVVGLTSTTIDDGSGFIIDADIEFNGEHQRFAIDGDPLAFDLRQIATHEVGHMLGLNHTPVEEAVMYESTEKGLRDKYFLHPDDIAGLIASHPTAAAPDTEPCVFAEPYPQWEPLCPEPDEGCGAARPGNTAWILWLLVLLGAWLRIECHARRTACAARSR